MDCVFCVKIQDLDEVKLTFVHGIYMFEPLNPVVPGHMLFVSQLHSKDAAAIPVETAYVFEAASWYAREQPHDFNLITSAGKDATQTIEHLHVHYVPRRPNDGLHLPWTGQVKKIKSTNDFAIHENQQGGYSIMKKAVPGFKLGEVEKIEPL